MKNRPTSTVLLGILMAAIVLLSALDTKAEPGQDAFDAFWTSDSLLKKEAFEILNTKCNACHRKQNPFMIFNEKNMSRRASKIHRMVFIERRMPKGDEVRLTNEEYVKLEKWLFTQDIF